MATTLVADFRDGAYFNWTATAAKAVGATIVQGNLVGVALTAATGSGDVIPVAVGGVYTMTKPTGVAFAQGAAVYSNSSGTLSATATGNQLVGMAWKAATSGAGNSTVQVALKGFTASVADV